MALDCIHNQAKFLWNVNWEQNRWSNEPLIGYIQYVPLGMHTISFAVFCCGSTLSSGWIPAIYLPRFFGINFTGAEAIVCMVVPVHIMSKTSSFISSYCSWGAVRRVSATNCMKGSWSDWGLSSTSFSRRAWLACMVVWRSRIQVSSSSRHFSSFLLLLPLRLWLDVDVSWDVEAWATASDSMSPRTWAWLSLLESTEGGWGGGWVCETVDVAVAVAEAEATRARETRGSLVSLGMEAERFKTFI